MPSAKPIRVIDVSKKLNLATTTVILFLKNNCYPVERSYHTPLLHEILGEIALEFGTGRSLVTISQLIEDSKLWESAHQDSAARIRDIYRKGLKRLKEKRDRAQKVRVGRERAKMMRQEFERRLVQFDTAMKSVVNLDSEGDGKIRASLIQLEIIHRALALDNDKKQKFVKYLQRFSKNIINA